MTNLLIAAQLTIAKSVAYVWVFWYEVIMKELKQFELSDLSRTFVEAGKVKINLTTLIWNWKWKRLEGNRKWKSLKIKQLLHSLNKHLENFLVLTHGKQKWRFLGLNDAFRLEENTRFHLEISFESATFAYHGNVMPNITKTVKIN